ncbi:MAG: Bacterial regulatory protein luxR family, partial [Actinomycetota bacterium]
GMTNKEIAELIGYSESLVRHETMIIYKKLRVEGRHQLREKIND